MRVISGSARRLLLKTVDSMETRPTTDRIKETLFNMIQFDIPGTDFLDLFSGSGGIGIEALSRDANRAVFVDNNSKAIQCISDNVERTGFRDRSLIIAADFSSALARICGMDYHFGIIYMDPPYGRGLERIAMKLLLDKEYVEKDCLYILETSRDEDISDICGMGYRLIREKKYKTNKHVFFSNP